MKFKRLILPLILSSILLLTGCGQVTELKDRLIVQAVGVDYKEGMFVVTLQVFSPQGGGGQSAFDASKLNNQIYQAQGNSILEALRGIEQSTGKDVFLGSNRIIVVGDETSKEWLPASLNFFNGNHETKPKTQVIVSKGEASDLVALQIQQGIVPANSIENSIKSAYESGFAVRSTMIDVIRSFNRSSESGAVIYMGEGEGFGGRKKPELLGTALLIDGCYVGTLDQLETRGARWVQGKIEGTTIIVDAADGGRYSATAKTTGHRVRVRLEDGKPRFDIRLSVDCSVPESLKREDWGVGLGDVDNLSAILEAEIRQEITMALTRCLQEEQTDIFQFHEYLEKYESDYWKQNKDNWKDLMGDSKVTLDIDVNIKSLGLGAQTTG